MEELDKVEWCLTMSENLLLQSIIPKTIRDSLNAALSEDIVGAVYGEAVRAFAPTFQTYNVKTKSMAFAFVNFGQQLIDRLLLLHRIIMDSASVCIFDSVELESQFNYLNDVVTAKSYLFAFATKLSSESVCDIADQLTNVWNQLYSVLYSVDTSDSSDISVPRRKASGFKLTNKKTNKLAKRGQLDHQKKKRKESLKARKLAEISKARQTAINIKPSGNEEPVVEDEGYFEDANFNFAKSLLRFAQNENKRSGRYIFLKDLSSNGTVVNEDFIGSGKFTVISSGDVISLVDKDHKAFLFLDFMHKENDGVPSLVKARYRVLSDLGSGACGLVKLAVRKSDCLRVACKCIDKSKFNFPSNSSKVQLMKEVSILKALDHPCVIKVVDVIDTEKMLCIFMELAEAGDLFKEIKLQSLIMLKWSSIRPA
ncbi:CHEK2 [Bugula neritina]|uniref:CHEK2 n=1 Tax=Bugula neritina TaxID=10212 RepID=A0A7J7J3E3_BUGNE|nr:CHEK2 [Bugula neritina]